MIYLDDQDSKISYTKRMEYSPIARELLFQMQDILNASAGYAVSIADEVEYFDPAASNGWWLAMTSDGGHPKAFIRHFKQNSDWSLGEIYVSPTIENRAVVAAALLEKFQNSVQFPSSHRLRFDISSHDEHLNRTLIDKGFSEKTQIFRFFEYSNIGGANSPGGQYASVGDAQEVAEALSNLHPVSPDEARKWIERKTILTVHDQARVVAAAQIYETDDALEVNRFATHEKHLRRGFARTLMNTVFQEARVRAKKCVYLKVEDNRAPAIAFYRSIGFLEKPNKCQTWHSRWY